MFTLEELRASLALVTIYFTLCWHAYSRTQKLERKSKRTSRKKLISTIELSRSYSTTVNQMALSLFALKTKAPPNSSLRYAANHNIWEICRWWLTYAQNVNGRKFGGIAIEASFAKGYERFKKSRKHDESDDERAHQFGDALEHDDDSGDDGKETGFPRCIFIQVLTAPQSRRIGWVLRFYSHQIAVKRSTFMIELMGGLTEKLCTDVSSTLILCGEDGFP
jgi:hypothetical protein